MRLPHFLCIGTPKAGTTWLYDRLKEHPGIFLPRLKEIPFFAAVDEDLYLTRGVEWYASYFRGARPDQVVGDITPYYLADPLAAVRIKETLPGCRMLVMLRNPVDRAYSHYWMAARKGFVRESFAELVADPGLDRQGVLSTGLYATHLEGYLRHFPKKRFLICLAEWMQSDPQGLLASVFDFVGADPSFVPSGAGSVSNGAYRLRSSLLQKSVYRVARTLHLSGFDWLREGVRRTGLPRLASRLNEVPCGYPPLPARVRRAAADYYRDDVRRLSGIVGRDLEHWLEDPSLAGQGSSAHHRPERGCP